jgi:hypothetical protein
VRRVIIDFPNYELLSERYMRPNDVSIRRRSRPEDWGQNYAYEVVSTVRGARTLDCVSA